jgi:hypothetical protein
LDWLYDRFEELYKGGNSLEIGAYRGMLTYLCAGFVKKKGGVHVVVDAFDIPIDEMEDNEHHYGEHTQEKMKESLGDLAKHIETVRSKSLDFTATNRVINDTFDYCFIDGDHRDPIVYLELCLCDGRVKHILGHDYGWPGVTKSVDRFMKERGYTIYQPLSGRGVFELTKI